MSGRREHKRHYNLRIEFAEAIAKWAEEEPSILLFFRWRRWLKRMPDYREIERRSYGG